MKFRTAILAAGKGTRMKQDLPKALTPVMNKPILQYLLESIEESGLDEKPIVVISKDGPRLGDLIGRSVDHVIQEQQLGTGHAVRSVQEAAQDAESLVVLYGDHPFLSPSTLKIIAQTHAQHELPITMGTVSIPSTDGWYQSFEKWGRILRDESRNVIGIKEYKDATEEEKQITERNPALFCFRTKWLWDRLERLTNENAQGEYYLTDVIAMAFSEGYSIPTVPIPPEEAIGINTPEEKEMAESILSKRFSL